MLGKSRQPGCSEHRICRALKASHTRIIPAHGHVGVIEITD